MKSGAKVKSIITRNTKKQPRSFLIRLINGLKTGASGLAYFTIEKDNKIIGKGPVGKFFSEDSLKEIMKICNASIGDSIFLSCGTEEEVRSILSLARNKIADELNLIDKESFAFCWIIDYPMFELDKKTNKIKLNHNPFSMPQGEIEN